MRARRRLRRGAALLEVLIALTIVTVAGVWAVTMTSGSMDAVRRARAADAESRRASAFLDAVALWPAEDLDRRLGARRQGDWMLRIERPAEALYVVTLSDSTERRSILRSAFHRRGMEHAASP